jgi:hypothetical protein
MHTNISVLLELAQSLVRRSPSKDYQSLFINNRAILPQFQLSMRLLKHFCALEDPAPKRNIPLMNAYLAAELLESQNASYANRMKSYIKIFVFHLYSVVH